MRPVWLEQVCVEQEQCHALSTAGYLWGGSALNEVWEWVIEDRCVSGGAGGW